ncbi:uncharacterized protein BDR25DRAFT_376455 [Lindgomyces ingoldianus]|uniref:Uncharacterized protein n=1 Tax=Lindgomyces ingoldianus TaxID=673940 RepID=A0ACB6QK09_9PLEO|nr:uncharacterized protein BDR25DRAFT_376455 [Lindgomyces ingoldianus]KAF2466913.1 hypothetical protein BDR25DRAFT_376455 [Lindgomyces ingoldianus]
MESFTKAHPDPEGITPLDVIFSCCVCHATFSEVYDGCSTVQGLSDGINPKERLVTKLWLSSCCHVICSKHLEGGAPPFHPAGTRPRAPCPVCAQERGEDRPRELYSVRGFTEGEFDSAIPACWFTTPPIKLDAAGKEMEALRFQYLSLVRYAKQLTGDHKEAKGKLDEAQNSVMCLQRLRAEEQTKLSTLEEENERLHAMEPELQKFKMRMPAIEHYLKQIPRMVEQNEQMKGQLASLGYYIPAETFAYHKAPYPFDENDNVIADAFGQPMDSSLKRTASSHTAGRSLVTIEARNSVDVPLSSSPQARPAKRQKPNSGSTEQNIHAPPPSRQKLHSRDLMPPPSGPLSKMKSMRRLWPLRKKSPNISLPSPALDSQGSTGDVQMYDNGHWEHVQPVLHANVAADDRPPTRHGYQYDGTPYMTGALPDGHSPYPTNSPNQHQESIGTMVEDAHHPTTTGPLGPSGGLPSEPSYIRLMDGLSCDTRLELELRDPRSKRSGQSHTNAGFGQHFGATRGQTLPHNHAGQQQIRFGHAFPNQSPNAPFSPAWRNRHPDPLRSNPPHVFVKRPITRPSVNPITPAPLRFQQPAERAESVVSPFFKNCDRNAQVYSRAGVNDRVASSQPSGGYHSHVARVASAQADWHEPRSLNGLSFFNSPRNTRNEPIPYDSGYGGSGHFVPSEPHYASGNIDGRGFIRRQDARISPYRSGSAYASSFNRPCYPQQEKALPPLRLPSLNRPSHSRAVPLPSAMPSIVSSHRTSVRSSRSQWDEQASTGARSGQHSRPHIPGNTFVTSRNIFSSAGRRSVRR